MKKSALLALIASIGLVFTSCGGESKKEITPTAADFTSGDLSRYVEVVEEPCELSFSKQDGAIESQYLRLNVKLRLKKEVSSVKGLDPQDFDFSGLLGVMYVDLIDENGNTVQDLSIKDSEMIKFKKLLQADKGTEETIVFEGTFFNSEDSPGWFEQSVKFTPDITGDIYVENATVMVASSDDNSSYEESSDDSSYESDSSIGSSEIDEWLDDYEEYVDSYISLMEKFKAGDMSAMSEYTDMLEKAQEMSSKISDVTGEMSSSQLERMNEIASKLTNAAM